jgi:RNA polymerase sigma factor (sigma-70 family)
MQSLDDGALLGQYVGDHSDEAFAELVARHVNLVYSVAIRQVGNQHQAEEITQAVFIILARKAKGFRHDKALSSWLFQATRLTASNFFRSEMRRHRREQEAQMESQLNEPEGGVWQQIAPMLAAAVASLNERDRRAIVFGKKACKRVEQEENHESGPRRSWAKTKWVMSIQALCAYGPLQNAELTAVP